MFKVKPAVLYSVLALGGVVLVFAYLKHKNAGAGGVVSIGAPVLPGGLGGAGASNPAVFTGDTSWLGSPLVNAGNPWEPPTYNFDWTHPDYTTPNSGPDYGFLPTTVSPIPEPTYNITPNDPVNYAPTQNTDTANAMQPIVGYVPPVGSPQRSTSYAGYNDFIHNGI